MVTFQLQTEVNNVSYKQLQKFYANDFLLLTSSYLTKQMDNELRSGHRKHASFIKLKVWC